MFPYRGVGGGVTTAGTGVGCPTSGVTSVASKVYNLWLFSLVVGRAPLVLSWVFFYVVASLIGSLSARVPFLFYRSTWGVWGRGGTSVGEKLSFRFVFFVARGAWFTFSMSVSMVINTIRISDTSVSNM